MLDPTVSLGRTRQTGNCITAPAPQLRRLHTGDFIFFARSAAFRPPVQTRACWEQMQGAPRSRPLLA